MSIQRRFKILGSIAAAGCISLSTVSVAHADSTYNGGWYAGVTQNTANGFAGASAWWMNSAGSANVYTKTAPAFVQGDFEDYNTDYTLNAWLERSTDGGATWSTLSGIHALSSTSTQQDVLTDVYYDGPGYLARACFQFTSWSGAAVHCGPAI